MLRLKSCTAVSAVSALLLTQLFTQPPAAAEPTPPPADVALTVPATKPAALESIAPDKRREVLGGGWETSGDRAVTTSGDATGFHVLVADAGDGYRWRTAASLSEPGFETDAWIGNICVTASGKRAVVVYAPRTFTNKPVLAERGAFTAIVDLAGGPVRKLPVQTSLAYFNPGCGPGESAILTQSGTEDLGTTRLLRLDTADGTLAEPIDVPGQLTSAVPTSSGIVAADSGRLVRVDGTGRRTVVAAAKGVPYRLAADAAGGVVYGEAEGDTATAVRRVALSPKGRGAVTTLATGSRMELSVRSARGGQVVVTGTGKTARAGSTPAGVTLADVPAGAQVSSSGGLAVTSVLRAHTKDPRVAPADPTSPQRVDITATALSTNKTFTLAVTPTAGAGQGAEPSPALGVGTTAAASPNDPADGDQRYCSVARNDPRNQAMQPKPRQVEWAIDQAVRGALTVQRPANWKNLGMPAYTPQGLFAPRQMEGGGHVPAQVMLGISAQESNMWQAARFAVPGVTANPLIGNYFGIDYYNNNASDDWTIRWDKADCGYGVMQITDGMRLAGKEKPGEVALHYDRQRAIALDFAANIARGLQILQDKWNQTRRAGLVINDATPDRIENWFFAVWAYNSGFYPNNNDGQPWGVGWLNNPANPNYPADRRPFMETSYADAAHPQDWPYPEKVMGFAGHPIELIETPGNLVHGFRAAWWLTDQDRYDVKPPVTQFCDASNHCRPGESHLPNDPDVIGEPAGPCAHKNSAGQYDLKCWYHEPNTWKPNCEQTCGNELLRFDPGYPYQEDATSYPPNCGFTGMPANALIVDNVANSVPSVRPCSMGFSNAGSFRFTFQPDNVGNYPGKIDVHQLGTGFAGQVWMSNTHQEPDRKAVGTWTLDRAVGPWARVLVHLPVSGARTQQARYEIDVDGNGTYRKHRYLPQQIGRNGWVSLGVYNFKGTPSIRLSNSTADGKGTVRVAWDAIAVQPLPGKPRHIVAALGDSYSSGEGAGNYSPESDADHGTPYWNACRRSRDAYPRKLVLPGDTASLGSLADQYDANHELGFVACSSAETGNVRGTSVPESWNFPAKYDEGEGQFHEIAQIDSGVLDEHTTLVTLTLGGNDESAFSEAITQCINPVTICANDDSFLSTYKAITDRTAQRLEHAIREIHQKAQNATIVLLAYPQLISTNYTCVGTVDFTMGEAEAMAELGDHLGRKQNSLIESLRAEGMNNVWTFSPSTTFQNHRVCDPQNWIHALRDGPNGDGDFHEGDKASVFCIKNDVLCLSRESFHPNPAGTSAYAQVLRNALSQIGYQGSTAGTP